MTKVNAPVSGAVQIEVGLILPNPEQPRKKFNLASLEELSSSIRTHGIVLPIVVEEAAGSFILHDGERRWRAAMLASLKTIPAMIVPALNGTGPQMRLERALIANIQREDMHPIEEARGFERLMQEFGLSVQNISERTGKHVSWIYGRLQLLKLAPEVQGMMIERRIRSTEGKVITALLSLPSESVQVEMAQKLAEADATADVIVTACKRYLAAKEEKLGRTKGSPAMEHIRLKPTGWDALKQTGSLPAHELIVEAVKNTCARCPLYGVASDANCRDCGLVEFVNELNRRTK